LTIGEGQHGQRLDVALTALVAGVSRSQLGRHIAEGAVTLNGGLAAPSQKVRKGDVVAWTPPPIRAVELLPEAIPLQVVHEDRWLIVIDKQARLVVHPAPGHEQGTLVNALLAHCQDLRGIGGELRPGIVHRLDQDTSGLMVVAKDDETMNALGADFRVHRVVRRYEALVVGVPPHAEGRLETWHGRDPKDRKRFSVRVRSGRKAITNWRLLARLPGGTARLEAELETGRTHQVRLHCVALGCPILGDALYGRPPRDERVRQIGAELGRQALHAKALGFEHPHSKRWLSFESHLPGDIQAALTALEGLA
jgi:23S rRNA pseudouridine1911/1915/1917 synthase